MSDKVSRLDYCQYLLVSQINYTLTNFADHSERLSHEAINRYLRGERITPRLVWDNVRAQVVATERGYVIFDDTVLDKNYSHAIELVRRQYSGNAHGVIKGIGVVTCVYVNSIPHFGHSPGDFVRTSGCIGQEKLTACERVLRLAFFARFDARRADACFPPSAFSRDAAGVAAGAARRKAVMIAA